MNKNDFGFYEEEIYFYPSDVREKNFSLNKRLPLPISTPEVLGIKIRLGNAPIVYNLKDLMNLAGTKPSPEFELQFKNHDVYTVTHAVGISRIKGNAKVKELQYNAEIVGLKGPEQNGLLVARTIDLLPNTKFKKVFEVNTDLQGSFEAGGKFSAQIPEELAKTLSAQKIDLGGDIKLELSTNSNFIGKINFNIQLPMVQATGISASYCSWILNPDKNPLLGDQLMVQTIAVPKGTETISYEITGLVKVDEGWFGASDEKHTPILKITVSLV